MLNNETDRFGSAAFADEWAIRKAGLFQRTPKSALVGFMGNRPLWYNGAGGLLLVAGARSGKLRDVLAYNVCSGVLSDENLAILDVKGELAAISADQTPDCKHCFYWNPLGMHGLPSHRCNPFYFLKRGSPYLVADAQLATDTVIESSGSSNAKYFEERAKEFLLAFILTLVEVNGTLTFPDLYRAINLIPTGNSEYLELAFEMTENPHEIAVRIEEEIAQARENPQGGFQGILGEIFRSVTALADPTLMKSLSPHPGGGYDFSFESLTEATPAKQVYFMPPAENVQSWSVVLKMMFLAARIAKSRAPSAPRITFIVDEAAQLGRFSALADLYTIAAGIGIRPWCIFQTAKQMNGICEDGLSKITSSAGLKAYFAIRDIEGASEVSRMLGAQTLEYEDAHRVERARHAKAQMLESLLNGGDPVSAGLNYSHHAREAVILSKQHRLLRTPDEVLNMPGDKQFIFADGLHHPIYADRKPYYEQRFMAGRYLGNPYHPDARGVRVKTRWGHKYFRVIRERVPSAYAHFPQYKDGYWRRLSEQ